MNGCIEIRLSIQTSFFTFFYILVLTLASLIDSYVYFNSLLSIIHYEIETLILSLIIFKILLIKLILNYTININLPPPPNLASTPLISTHIVFLQKITSILKAYVNIHFCDTAQCEEYKNITFVDPAL